MLKTLILQTARLQTRGLAGTVLKFRAFLLFWRAGKLTSSPFLEPDYFNGPYSQNYFLLTPANERTSCLTRLKQKIERYQCIIPVYWSNCSLNLLTYNDQNKIEDMANSISAKNNSHVYGNSVTGTPYLRRIIANDQRKFSFRPALKNLRSRDRQQTCTPLGL